jgi:hypothetical protein
MPNIPTTRFLTFTVQYFRKSGKYYTTGYFAMTAQTCELEDGKYSVCMDTPTEHLKGYFKDRQAPGLSGWYGDFYALLDHPEGYPCLLMPTA